MAAEVIRVALISEDAKLRDSLNRAIQSASTFTEKPLHVAVEIAAPCAQVATGWLDHLRIVEPEVVFVDVTNGTQATASVVTYLKRALGTTRMVGIRNGLSSRTNDYPLDEYLDVPVDQTAIVQAVRGRTKCVIEEEVVMTQPPRRGTPAIVISDTGAHIEGRFETTESIEIGCEFAGEITAGQLIVHEGGRVNATARVVDAVIAGQFDGDLIVTGSLEIAATGSVAGIVQTDSLTVKKGARFLGQVKPLAAGAEERRASEPLIAVLNGATA